MSVSRQALIVMCLVACIAPATAGGLGYDPVVDGFIGGHRLPGSSIDGVPPMIRGGSLFASEVSEHVLLTVDPSTAAVIVVGSILSPVVAGLAYDEDTGMLYGTDTQTRNLVRIDPLTGNTTTVGATGVELPHGAAIDPVDGSLYVVGWDSSQEYQSFLYSVDTSTGAASVIGAVGYSSIGALDFDPTSNVLYGARGGPDDTAGSLVTIDTATGAGTLVAATHRMTGISFDSSGQLYGVDNGSMSGVPSSLYLIDKSDGSWILIGSMEVSNVLGLVFGVSGSPVESTSWAGVKVRYRSDE